MSRRLARVSTPLRIQDGRIGAPRSLVARWKAHARYPGRAVAPPSRSRRHCRGPTIGQLQRLQRKQMSRPLSPPEVTSRVVGALPPYVSNGVIGLRYPGLPHLPGTTMVNGFAGRNPDDGVEGFARAPFAIATDVQLDGVWASDAPEWTRLRRQRYDFATGELHTSWEFRRPRRYGDGRNPWCFARGPSRPWRHAEISVKVDRPADIAVAAGIDPADVPGRGDAHAQPQHQGPNEGVDGRLRWHPPGEISTLGMAYATTFRGDEGRAVQTATRDERGWFSTTYRVRARTDRTYRVTHITASVPDLSHAQPDEQAGRLAALGRPPRLRASA